MAFLHPFAIAAFVVTTAWVVVELFRWWRDYHRWDRD